MKISFIYSNHACFPEIEYLCKLFGSLLNAKITPCHINRAGDLSGISIGYCDPEAALKLPDACRIRILADESFWNEYLHRKSVNPGFKVFQNIKVLNSNPDEPFLLMNPSRVSTNLDIFCSAFYIISFLEQLNYSGEYDRHGRYTYSNGNWSKHYIDLPVINLYADILTNWIEKAYAIKVYKNRSFSAVISHDIDAPFYFRKFKTELSELLNSRQPSGKYHNAADLLKYIGYLFRIYPDPFDTFDYIQEQEEARGIRSTYFIMVSRENEWGLDLKKYSRRLERILSKENEVALHPGYTSYCRPDSLIKERNKLESLCGIKPSGVRNHFLRMQIPAGYHSCRMLEFEYDSTLGYPDREGFRAGICIPYKPYDIYHRKMIDIMEIPLNIMDGTLKDYCRYPSDMALERIKQHIDMVKAFQGAIVFNWHNTFLIRKNEPWRRVFEGCLDYLVLKGARFRTCRELASTWKELWE